MKIKPVLRIVPIFIFLSIAFQNCDSSTGNFSSTQSSEAVASLPAPQPSSTPATPPTPELNLPAAAPTLQVSTTQIAPGGSITVKVGGTGANAQEWVALYLAGNPDSAWSYNENWNYLNGTKTPSTALLSSATLQFIAPLDPGVYNIRLFASNGYGKRLALSSNITVTAPLIPGPVASYVLYVSPSGSDSNPGTQAAPFRTIQKAANIATAGTDVHVASGTYPENIDTSKSGTATARIRFISDVKGGAKIVPPANSTSSTTWHSTGAYIDIIGFDIDGTEYQSGVKWRGGMHILGSNSLIQNNTVHHFAMGPTDCADSFPNGGGGIVTDNYLGGTNIVVNANVVHDMGVKCTIIHGIYFVASGKATNNIVWGTGGTGIVMWHDTADIVIANNTIANSHVGINAGGSKPDKIRVANNIVYNCELGIIEESSTSTYGVNTFANNLVYGSSKSNFATVNTPTGSVIADPQFVNASVNDYRLKSTSPAIDKATPTYAPTTDFSGTARPQGGGIDIGAFEFQ